MANSNDVQSEKPILLQALEPVSSGQQPDKSFLNAALRNSVFSLRRAISLGSLQDLKRVRAVLERCYGYLGSFTIGNYGDAPEFHLGRMASLIDLAGSFEPMVTEKEQMEMINPESESGKRDLEVLRLIANHDQINNQEMLDIYHDFGKTDSGLDRLVLAGYIMKERHGTSLYPRLTLAGYKFLSKYCEFMLRTNPP